MNIEMFEGYMTAQTPISHGSDDKLGNDISLRRLKYHVNGKYKEIPVISANSLRGILRRRIMTDFMERMNYKCNSKKIFRFLMAGGILEEVSKKDSGILNLSMREEIRKLMPPIDLLGGTLGNQNFDGKLDVMPIQVICKELEEFLPSNTEIAPDKSIHEFIDWDFATTKDPLGGSDGEGDKSAQMIYNWEVFVPGTPFTLGFVLRDADEIVKGCFIRLLNLWHEYPVIGGKAATGHGRVKINIDYSKEDEKDYLNYIDENKEKIVSKLDLLCKEYTP